MADRKRLDELASIGRDFIGLQFRPTPDDLTHSIDQPWVLGCCFGVLDAVRQKFSARRRGYVGTVPGHDTVSQRIS